MKFFKTDIFNDNYQHSENKDKFEKKFINNYVNGTLSSNLNFMSSVRLFNFFSIHYK